MTFEQILPFIRQGKKVRRAAWWAEDFMVFKRGKMFILGYGNWGTAKSIGLDNLIADDWEVFEWTLAIAA